MYPLVIYRFLFLSLIYNLNIIKKSVFKVLFTKIYGSPIRRLIGNFWSQSAVQQKSSMSPSAEDVGWGQILDVAF